MKAEDPRNAIILFLSRFFWGLLRFLGTIFISFVYGSGPLTDALFIAWVFPVLFSVNLRPAVMLGFIPEFIDRRIKKGDKEAYQMANTFITKIILCLAVGACLYFFFSPFVIDIIGYGFSSHTMEISVTLTRMVTPLFVFIAFFWLMEAILNAHKHFTSPAIVGCLFPVGTIFGVLVLSEPWGIYGVAVGTVLGAGMQALIQFVITKRAVPSFSFDLKSQVSLRSVYQRIPSVLAIGIWGQIVIIVDRVLASSLSPGKISALVYAERTLFFLPTIATVSLIRAMLQDFSAQISRERYEEFQDSVLACIKVVSFVVVPFTVGSVMLRVPLIRLIFQRGEFDAIAMQLCSVAWLHYAVGLIPQSMCVILATALLLFKRSALIIKMSLSLIVIKTALSILLVQYLDHGGLALSTSVMYWVMCCALVIFLRKALPSFPWKEIVYNLGKVLVPSGIMGIVLYYLSSQMVFDPALSAGKGECFQTVGIVSLGAITYFACSAARKTSNLKTLFSGKWRLLA